MSTHTTWHIGIATGACPRLPILEMLPHLHESGAAALEIGTPPQHFDPWSAEQTAALDARLRENDLPAVSIHAPFGKDFDIADPNATRRRAAVYAVLTAVHALGRLGGELVVVHPSDLERAAHDVPARLADSLDSLRTLTSHCRDAHMRLVVETPLPHLVGGHPDELAWLLPRLDDDVGVCIDTGHAALGGHWRALVALAGDRLCHVHANDNRGQFDDHLPPGEGIVDWADVAGTLRDRAFQGWIMLELACPDADPPDYFRRALHRAVALFGPGPAVTSTSLSGARRRI